MNKLAAFINFAKKKEDNIEKMQQIALSLTGFDAMVFFSGQEFTLNSIQDKLIKPTRSYVVDGPMTELDVKSGVGRSYFFIHFDYYSHTIPHFCVQ